MKNLNLKRVLSIVLLLVLTLSLLPMSALAATDGHIQAVQENALHVIMPDATHGFLSESIRHAEDELQKLAAEMGLTYELHKTTDASEQSACIDEALQAKAGAVVLWPITGEPLRNAAERVKDAGIPLIIYDRLIEGFTPDSEVLGDNMKIARMAGMYFNSYFAAEIASGETINILELAGDDSTVPKQRTQGFMELAGDNVNVARRFDTQWQREVAREQMTNWLKTASVAEIESVQAIYSHEDETILGAMDAIAAYTGSAKCNIRLLIGLGGKRDLLMHMGYYKDVLGIDLVTYQFSPAMIREAIQDGVQALSGKTIAAEHLIDTFEIDHSTVGAYLASDAYKTRYTTAMPKVDDLRENEWYSFAVASRAIEFYERITRVPYNPDTPCTVDFGAEVLAQSLPYGVSSGSGGEALTREVLAAMLFEKLSEYRLAEINGAPSFTDAELIGGEYKAAVEYVYKTGLMIGIGGNRFDPKGVVTHAQITMVMYNAVEACLKAAGHMESTVNGIDSLFRRSVIDAITVEPEEILPVLPLLSDTELTTWNTDGQILMVTWNRHPERYKDGETVTLDDGEVWTFTDKEIAEWYRQNSEGVTDWELRFKQLIGLPPDAEYTHFTAIWVDPGDLLRPAYIQDITVKAMSDSFAADADPEFIRWFDANAEYSYYVSAYPWTRLGYTYDWAQNGTEYGLSEFIIMPGSVVTVEFTLTTNEFLDWLDSQSALQKAA